jgi:pyruvate/2-oxoglutarate dehydrogenase complex dihydrolipoamide acyltransferase (E2) component
MPPETTELLAGATIEVTMPPTGSEAPVTLIAWLKHPGETVASQEAICVVEWGESSAEVATPADGVLRMVTVAAGERLIVGSTLAVVDVAVTAKPGRFTLDPLQG